MAIQIKNLDIPTIRVKVDREKCQLPMVCDYKCYTKCPQGVFHVHSYPNVSGRFMKPDPNSPKHYLVTQYAHLNVSVVWNVLNIVLKMR